MSETTTIPPEYKADMQWAFEHTTELHSKYENLWVAIVRGEVVAAGPDLGPVEDLAARRTGRDTREIYVELVEDGCAVYGLCST